MKRQCANKKVKKRMFLFSNGMGETAHSQDQVKNYIGELLKNNEIKLNIIPINFMEGYDMLSN